MRLTRLPKRLIFDLPSSHSTIGGFGSSLFRSIVQKVLDESNRLVSTVSKSQHERAAIAGKETQTGERRKKKKKQRETFFSSSSSSLFLFQKPDSCKHYTSPPRRRSPPARAPSPDKTEHCRGRHVTMHTRRPYGQAGGRGGGLDGSARGARGRGKIPHHHPRGRSHTALPIKMYGRF